MLKKFTKDQTGSTAIVFAFALIPLVGMVGLSVDYARASNSKQALQAALDSTVLSLTSAARTESQAQLEARAAQFIAASFKPRGPHVVAPVVVKRDGNTISVSTSATLNTAFMQVLGPATVTVSGTATATFSNRSIEMSLALDNTGSMGEDQNGNYIYVNTPGGDAGTKIRALKDASLAFVGILQQAGAAGSDVKIGLVPFDTEVRVSTSYANDGWIKYNTPGLSSAVSQGAWQGCLTDRDQPHDTADVVPDGTNATRAPAVQCSTGTLAAIQPLTTNFANVTNRIKSMQPSGYTNVAMGAVWGASLLSTSAPFAEASAASTVDKSLLILTDGNNTRSRHTNSVAAMNAKTLAACNSAKASGITVYTVRLLQGDAATLKSCASVGPNGPLYYDVQDLADLKAVLKDIANKVTKVQLKS